MLSISEMGNGWALAVINSQEECDFLKLGQGTLRNSVPYWIGGSTNITPVRRISYSSYITNQLGMVNLSHLFLDSFD